MRALLVALTLGCAGVLAGCPGDAGVPDAPGSDVPGLDGGGRDGGRTDGGGTDSGSTDDGGGGMDGGGDDAGGDLDAPASDGGGGSDAPVALDGGGLPDVPGAMGCRTNMDCARTDYCAKVPGDCSGAGICTVRPDACSLIFDPVCGCDGRDYSNACVAASSGVNVASRGMCGSMTCDLRPRSGCCFLDAHCTGSIGGAGRCMNATCSAGAEGTCVDPVLGRGECWDDSDCASGRTCMGARICPCGAACPIADAPGTCG